MSDDNETPETKPLVQEEKPKLIWMACRATPGCEGRTANLVRNFETAGGRVVRYVCTTCNRHWHVPIGGSISQ